MVKNAIYQRGCERFCGGVGDYCAHRSILQAEYDTNAQQISKQQSATFILPSDDFIVDTPPPAVRPTVGVIVVFIFGSGTNSII